MKRALFLALLLLLLSAGGADARGNDGGPNDEIRVAGDCGQDTTLALRLRTRDDGIEIRLRLTQSRRWGAWRITIVHENRVAFRFSGKTTRAEDSLALRRTIDDFPGSDAIVVHAWGPAGLSCRAAATL